MAIADYPIHNYPTVGYTNAGTLYTSLGSFWTQLFEERASLKGYTLAQSEELIQHYYNLIEVVQSYSVKDVPVFHKERWYPIKIRKSEYNNVPLLFRSSDDPEYAVFGPQKGTPTDKYYENVTFIFGFPKTPVAEVYGVQLPKDLKQISVLANRVFDPSLILSNDIDFRINGSICYFNKDIFQLDNVPKYNIFNDDGSPMYYTDKTGEQVQEQEIILWAYNTQIDTSTLFNNFGYIFDINMENNQFFKDILKATVGLFVDGPTVKTARALACSFLGVAPIVEAEEVVEDTFITGDERIIVTDKNVYRCNKYYTILPQYRSTPSDPDSLIKGLKVKTGDVLVDAAQYFDYVQSKDWWRTGLIPKIAMDSDTGAITKYPEMAFPPHLFLGNYKHHFIFSNDLQLVTRDANGDIHFPIFGNADDVTKFHLQLNEPVADRDKVADALGLAVGGAVVVNPLDFIFNNFFKHNTSLIKLNFINSQQVHIFTTLYDVVKEIFPKHVYLMFFIDFSMENDIVETNNTITVPIWNASLDVPAYEDKPANADGSSSEEETEGQIVMDVTIPNYKTDISERLFSLSQGINLTSNDTTDYSDILDYDSGLLRMVIVRGNTLTPSVDNTLAYKDGGLVGTIPEGASMKDVNSLILLNFS